MLHVALDVWKDLDDTSKEWKMSQGEILRMCGASLFGKSIYKLDLGKIWSKISDISQKKANKLLQASQLITLAKDSKDAILNIQKQLGLNLQPSFGLAESNKKSKKKITSKILKTN